VEPDDIEAVREVLPGIGFIVLVKPFPNGNCTVRIFGAAEFNLLEQFDLIMGIAPVQPEPIAYERPFFPAEATVESTPALSPRQTPDWFWPLTAAALIMIVGAGMLFIWVHGSLQRTRSAAAVSDLGMRVEKQDGGYRVVWNGNLSAFRNSNAVLRINDGFLSRELNLDPHRLASGSLTYPTESNDVTFRMLVRGDQGGQVTDSVHMIVAALRPPDRVEPLAPRAVESKPDLVTPAVRFWPTTARRAGAFKPAVPLHQVMPEVRSSFIRKPAMIKVHVTINDKGQVTSARALNSPPAISSDVPEQAIDASRQWTFEPARRRGHNVLSDYTIVYSFSPRRS
jgi:TonB family protein